MKKNIRKNFNISRLAIKYSWLTVSFWITVCVAGLFAFSSLKYALFPDITFPVVIVNAKAPIVNAMETEAQLTNIIEESLINLGDVDEFNSVTYPGQSIINLLFYPNIDLKKAEQEVKEKLTSLSLPDHSNIEIIPYNLNESSAITYALQSETKDIYELIEISQNNIIPLLDNLPGVLRVNLLGNKTDQSPTIVNFNGKESLAIEIIKEGQANTLEVVSLAEKEIIKLEKELPEINFKLASTEAYYIREATQATIDSLILAIILAVVIIYLFLRKFLATLITAIAIPISLLGTCIVMAIAGFNLETITLLALALVIGIIVDDAIVDVENISRYLEAGKKPKEAAILATDEIGLTVSASTLTVVAVFLPIAFMGGTIGQFFKPFALTVSVAVLISLLVARTLSPVLCMWWLKSNPKLLNQSSFLQLTKYQNLLKWALGHRKIVTLIAVFITVVGVALIPLIPQSFIPKLDRGEFNIVFTTPLPRMSLRQSPSTTRNNEPNTDENSSFNWISQLANSPGRILLNRSNRIAQEIEPIILDYPDVASAFTVIGERGEVNKGKIHVKLKGDRTLNTATVQENLRQELANIENATISVEDIEFIDRGGEKPLQLALLGQDLQKLTDNAQQIKDKITTISGFVDVEATEFDEDKIIHRNAQRVAYISANLGQNKALGDALTEITTVAKAILSPGITLDVKGDTAYMKTVFESFGVTLILSIAFMLVFLILPFGRLLEPMVVGLCLPLAIIGAMVALLVTQSDFGMISLIGFIFLLGLLDKNAILLMDYANQLRQTGMSRYDALLTTGTTRLRPILMTTASTILGMLPIALGWGVGAELRQPMAVAIIGGLITSSFLSLIVVPVFYTLWEDIIVLRSYPD
jgi:multidrug efflux pump subunit AcrB